MRKRVLLSRIEEDSFSVWVLLKDMFAYRAPDWRKQCDAVRCKQFFQSKLVKGWMKKFVVLGYDKMIFCLANIC